MFHGWMFDPDGDQAAADSTRSSSCLDTGSSVNPRTDRRLVTASYTSIIHRLLAASHRHAGLVDQDLSTTFPAVTWARSLYFPLLSLRTEFPSQPLGSPNWVPLTSPNLTESSEGKNVEQAKSIRIHLTRSASAVARVRWTNETAIDPSPTADATRLTLPHRTSPTANTPGSEDSSRYGGRSSGHRAAARSSCVRSHPVLMKPFASSVTRPFSQPVLASAPVIRNTCLIS